CCVRRCRALEGSRFDAITGWRNTSGVQSVARNDRTDCCLRALYAHAVKPRFCQAKRGIARLTLSFLSVGEGSYCSLISPFRWPAFWAPHKPHLPQTSEGLRIGLERLVP